MNAASEGFDRLEDLVEEALKRLSKAQRRAATAEERAEELERLLKRHEKLGGKSADVVRRLESAESENRDLRDRLARGRESAERLLARIRFLEEQR